MKRPLILCSVTISLLWLLRVSITDSFRYDFIIWNIFLASVPLLLEPVFQLIKQHVRGIVAHISRVITAFVWLLFLPNAFYILTDFMHLNSRVAVNARDDTRTYSIFYARGDGLYVFDTLLLFAATAFGAYVGGLALLHAHRYFRKKVSRAWAGIIILLIMILSAAGVYIGRFGRWNSWEGITHPYEVVADLITTLINPGTVGRFCLIILTMVIFQTASLLFVHYQQKVLKK